MKLGCKKIPQVSMMVLPATVTPLSNRLDAFANVLTINSDVEWPGTAQACYDNRKELGALIGLSKTGKRATEIARMRNSTTYPRACYPKAVILIVCTSTVCPKYLL